MMWRINQMTYIITEPCVDPIYYINPDECIDCAACEPVCPVEAIFAEDDVPDDQREWIDVNYEYFGLSR